MTFCWCANCQRTLHRYLPYAYSLCLDLPLVWLYGQLLVVLWMFPSSCTHMHLWVVINMHSYKRVLYFFFIYISIVIRAQGSYLGPSVYMVEGVICRRHLWSKLGYSDSFLLKVISCSSTETSPNTNSKVERTGISLILHQLITQTTQNFLQVSGRFLSIWPQGISDWR